MPPDPLPAGEPGDIIRWRESVAGPRHAIANAWQVMYLSTNALGQRHAVTGTVLVPRNVDPSTAPIIGFAVGTQGPAFRCTPSYMQHIGALYEQPAVDDFLKSGYAVAMTDYEGTRPEPNTTWVAGRSEGPAVIDSVRAAQRLEVAGLSVAAKVIFRGYSQGGGAALWAGQLQPTYAPELNLVGVVGGGVPADLVQVALPLDGRFGSGFLLYALMALDNAYPELQLDSYLNDAGRAAFVDMKQNSCTLELLTKYANKQLASYTTESPLLDDALLARVAENKLGTMSINVPVYQYHATQDDLVEYSQAQALRDTYCQAGVKVTWKAYATDHITLVYTGNADSLAFIRGRVSGAPATSTC